MKNIILIGMPGAGKSTVGVLLAKSMAYDFCDTDLVIQKQQGRTLQEIIDSDGLDGFLKAEEDALLSVEVHNTVIATGGSAVFSEAGMSKLKENGVCVYLKVPTDELVRRLTNIKTRGIACKKGETVADILLERAPYYEKYADVTVECAEHAEDTVEMIIRDL
ncbi:MAG: shikimate kinase [Eubacterium sp.]|nr:shikimate kinase [Eubacterium sp.]